MKIVFFDGHCNLCNGVVDWLLRLDKKGVLKFASLQGETAKRVLKQQTLNATPDTIIYTKGIKKYERSEAVLRILGDLSVPWCWMKVFLLVPTSLRDYFYRIIAANRYKLFGQRETCRLPTPEETERLLD